MTVLPPSTTRNRSGRLDPDARKLHSQAPLQCAALQDCGDGGSEPAERSEATPPPGDANDAGLRIESLAGWHIPLLGDPAYLPLHPLLQQAVLLSLPEKLLQLLRSQPSLGPQVLVAFEAITPVGLIVTRRLNRSGSCWQVQHLRLSGPTSRRQVASALLREAIDRGRGASSWIATASSGDADRLAILREQGFQPLRTDRLWRWPAADRASHSPSHRAADRPAGDAGGLQLRNLNRRTAALLWHLEQAACPAHLRQLLDRRVEDLLDQSRRRGWMLVDPSRDQAVAAVRWVSDHASGGYDVKLTVHPGWQHLFGGPVVLLLNQAQQALGSHAPLWLACDIRQESCQQWLQRSGAEERGERVLMARSVWRRQELQAPAQLAARRLEAMLEQWQPKRRPLPTPLGPR
ncbi:conserved hypothetical protein [Cyanobium sp. PCC 7001]|uniref:hypothetical protein n=1 Tax=Cyanobium sp. PCC 7001 TaxID=180281 RepID=UPI00018057BB|nr:hypothetical protein [Cyanobium sp. PCC 7001]EDY39315.1 conserved hypothetical protein [Cyanobium sp. PCC 7001]